MKHTADDLIQEYLEQVNAALAGLPRSRRREVVQEIAEHIADARAELPSENEAQIRDLLDRLGDPAEIAAEADDRPELQPRKRGWVEIAALVLLPFGGVILPVVGWLVGVLLLWLSDAWTTRDKLLGTFIVPGGLMVPAYVLVFVGSQTSCSEVFDSKGDLVNKSCTGGASELSRILWPTLVIGLVLASLATTVYLARRSGRRAGAGAGPAAAH